MSVVPQASASRKETREESFEAIIDSADREKWLAARDTGIGASEASTLFDANPWESPFTLYQKKRGEIEPQADNEPMKWGRRLEDVVGSAFSEETGRKVWKHPLGGVLLRSRAYPWILATPDFEQQDASAAEPGLLECKTTGAHSASYWEEDVPLYYQIQMQQQLLVTGRGYNSVACLIGGQKFVFKHFVRHEAFLQRLIARTKEFWDMLQAGTPPPLDASESTVETLTRMREDGRVVDLPQSVLLWHDKMLDAAERRKAAEKEEKAAKREVSAAMGTASFGVLPNGAGMFKFVTRDAYDVAAHTVPASRQLKFSKRIELPKTDIWTI